MIPITNKPNNGKDDDDDDDDGRQWWYVGSVDSDSGCYDQLMLSSPPWMEPLKITATSTWGILVQSKFTNQSVSQKIKCFSFKLQRATLFNYLGEEFSCFQKKPTLIISTALNSTKCD